MHVDPSLKSVGIKIYYLGVEIEEFWTDVEISVKMEQKLRITDTAHLPKKKKIKKNTKSGNGGE